MVLSAPFQLACLDQLIEGVSQKLFEQPELGANRLPIIIGHFDRCQGDYIKENTHRNQWPADYILYKTVIGTAKIFVSIGHTEDEKTKKWSYPLNRISYSYIPLWQSWQGSSDLYVKLVLEAGELNPRQDHYAQSK